MRRRTLESLIADAAFFAGALVLLHLLLAETIRLLAQGLASGALTN